MASSTGRYVVALCLFGVAGQSNTIRTQVTRIPLSDVLNHSGETVTVCGTVVESECNPARQTLLTFDGDFPDVRVTIPPDARARFAARLEDKLLGRVVCATGRVQASQIVASDPGSLTVEREPPAPPPVLAPTARRACDAGVEFPKVIRDARPSYTPEAMRDRIRGFVLMEGVVLEDGSVGDVRLLRSLHPGLDDECVRAFKQWQFEPGTYLGRPAPIVVYMKMAFTMK